MKTQAIDKAWYVKNISLMLKDLDETELSGLYDRIIQYNQDMANMDDEE